MKRKAKIMAMAKGFRGRAKNVPSIAYRRVSKAIEHAYIDRKKKKRDFRTMWIQTISSGTKEHGINYSTFIAGTKVADIQLNRKVLASMAMTEPFSFKAVVEAVKTIQAEEKAASRILETPTPEIKETKV